MARDGTLYIADADNMRVRFVTADGVINTLIGNASSGGAVSPNDGVPVGQALIGLAGSLALTPDGTLLMALEDNTIRNIKPPFPGGVLSANILIPAGDRESVYEFDPAGRHLRTRHELTGAALYSFGYDGHGLLTSVVDGSALD